MTENIIESTIDEAKKRLSESPFWSSFIISWLVINWKVLYISTSLNSTTISDKIDAIEKLHPNLFDRIISLGILPLIASFIAIAVVPFINHFYLWLRKYHRDRDADIEIQKTQKEIAVLEVKKDLQEKEKELKESEKDKWDDEYKNFSVKYPGILDKFSTIVYAQDGYVSNYVNIIGGNKAELLKPAHLFGLIEDNAVNPIKITEKGVYFLRQAEQERQ